MAVVHPDVNGAKKAESWDDEFPFGRPPFIATEMPFNPFMNNSVPFLGFWEVTKTILMLPIFLLRAILLLLMFILGYLTTRIALIGATNTLTRPFPPWRRNMMWPVRLCARGVLFACGYNWIRVKGRAAPRDVAPVLVFNHVSFIDPVFVFFAHLPMIVTAKENLDIPIAGAVMRAIQVVAVDRSSPTSRKDAAGEIKRRAMCNDWAHVALFPEATTTNGRALVSFKTGAFSPGLPVQPVVVRYPHVGCDPSWVVEGPPIHLLLFRLMTQLHNYMEVEYLEVMEPTKKEVQSPYVFADRCRMRMARALNVNVTEHTFGDVALALEAAKLNPTPPPGLTNVEFGRMERLFKLDVREAKGYLRKFTTMDVTRSGLVTMNEFLAALDLPDTPATRRVFFLFDTSERGYINFREFVAGLAFLSKHTQFKESIEAAFRVSDADEDGALSREEADVSLRGLFPDITDEQVSKLFQSLDMDKNGSISWTEFSDFLQKNPEYLAAILMAKPSLAPSASVGELNGKANGSA